MICLRCISNRPRDRFDSGVGVSIERHKAKTLDTGLTYGTQSSDNARGREYAERSGTGIDTATTTWLSSNPPSLWRLVGHHGCWVRNLPITNGTCVRPVTHRSASNNRSYVRKNGRQDEGLEIIVVHFSHASMKIYQPRPQSVHLNHDLAATGHGTAHFNL